MARFIQYLSHKITSVDPQSLTSLIIISASVQYACFYIGMKKVIHSNFNSSALALSPRDYWLGGQLVGGPVIANINENEAFKLNIEMPKALTHQLLAAVLITSCINTPVPAKTVAVAACCFAGCFGSSYLSWSPIIRLLSLSSIVRDGNETAYTRLSFMTLKLKQFNNSKPQVIISLITMASTLGAIAMSLSWRWSLPTAVLYLVAVTF